MFSARMSFSSLITSCEIRILWGFLAAFFYRRIERYILEWLGLMASAGLIKIDNQTEKYYITAEMKICLNGMAIDGCIFLSAFIHAFPHVCDGFKLNGPNGIPIFAQQLLMHGMDMERKNISEILDTDIVNAFPGFRDRLESGITVADIGCSSGRLAIALAETFPNSQIYGLDFDEQAIALGRQRGQEKNLKNLHMVTQDALNLPIDYKDMFDVVIAMYFIHDLPFPKRALEQLHFALKPTDGVLCMIEADVPSGQKNHIADPEAIGLYGFSVFDCVPSAMNSDGATALGICAGRKVLSECAMSAGFKDIRYTSTKLGVIIACRK